MRISCKVLVLFSFVLLAACSKPRQIGHWWRSLEPAFRNGDSSGRFAFFRSLDGKHIDLADTPNPYENVVYVLTSGKHVIGAMNIQGGHIVYPEDLRCYRIEADLAPGLEYMIAEDKDNQIAYVKRKDNDERIAVAKPFEKQTAYSGGCNWK